MVQKAKNKDDQYDVGASEVIRTFRFTTQLRMGIGDLATLRQANTGDHHLPHLVFVFPVFLTTSRIFLYLSTFGPNLRA